MSQAVGPLSFPGGAGGGQLASPLAAFICQAFRARSRVKRLPASGSLLSFCAGLFSCSSYMLSLARLLVVGRHKANAPQKCTSVMLRQGPRLHERTVWPENDPNINRIRLDSTLQTKPRWEAIQSWMLALTCWAGSARSNILCRVKQWIPPG